MLLTAVPSCTPACPAQVVYTRNATEAINLVANTWGAAHLREGDEVVLSVAEHHSNIVPWQLLAQRKGLVLKCARWGWWWEGGGVRFMPALLQRGMHAGHGAGGARRVLGAGRAIRRRLPPAPPGLWS